MLRILLLLFIIVPTIEIAVLILSGSMIGFWPTVTLIICTSVIGALLAKKEGLQVLQLAQMQMSRREIPSAIVLDGICVLIGGFALILPGFITDLFGFYLLIPYTRGTVKALLVKLFERAIRRGNIIFFTKR